MIIASTPRTSVVDIYKSPLIQINLSIPKWVKMAVHTLIERFIDKDRLPSEIWRAEMQEVQLRMIRGPYSHHGINME